MSQPPKPPSCSECATKAEAPEGSATAQSSSRMWRSSSGSMRTDTAGSSIISNPAAQKAILLDHLKKEATIIPMAAASGGAPSGSPKMPSAVAPPPAMQVQDLGKSMTEGHEVEGKRYVLPVAQKPQMPAMPRMPQIPGLPKTAQAPAPPRLPKVPPPRTAAERCRGLDQRQVKNTCADQSHERFRFADNLLQAHLDPRAPSLDVRDSGRVQGKEFLNHCHC
jgi:hypothetical protein